MYKTMTWFANHLILTSEAWWEESEVVGRAPLCFFMVCLKRKKKIMFGGLEELTLKCNLFVFFLLKRSSVLTSLLKFLGEMRLLQLFTFDGVHVACTQVVLLLALFSISLLIQI